MKTYKIFLFRLIFKREIGYITEIRNIAFQQMEANNNFYYNLGRKSAFDYVIGLLINKDF